MRTFKTFCLSVLPRAVDMGDRCYLSLNVFAAFDLADTPRILLEQSLWRFLPAAAPGFAEAGMPKVRTEYLVFGNAHSADAVPVPRLRAGVRFAGKTKALNVWGERHWDGRGISAPLPFTSAPLDWSLAFGGADLADNPVGLGHVKGILPAPPLAQPLLLPRLEEPTAPWVTDMARNKCAGFSPIEIDKPQRTCFQGSFDESWLKQRAPAMPADFNWRFYQVAPEDQQFEQALAGNESFEWHNLHPTLPLIAGALPGICPAAFICRVGETDLEPVPTQLRTVLFFPEQQRVVLIWQGVAHTADEEMNDLAALLVGAERLGQPKSIEHYQQVFQDRSDRKNGMLAVLREQALLPDGLDFEPLVDIDGILTADPPADSFAARATRRAERVNEGARAEVAALGMNPDEHAPPAKLAARKLPTKVEDLPAFFEALQRETLGLKERAMQAVESTVAASERDLAHLPFDAALLRREIHTPPSGPPLPLAPGRIDGLKSLTEQAKASGVDIGEIHQMADDKQLHGEWHDGDRMATEQYRRHAHHQAPSTRAEQRHAKRQQQWVQERLNARQPLAGLDLTGADLRAFDFRGVNLDKAMLESALLSGVRFDGASMCDAVLAHADLEHAVLDGCDLARCNLGKAKLGHASLVQASLDHAILSNADLSAAKLTKANLAHAQVQGALLNDANLDGAVLDGLLLNELCLDGASLVGAFARKTVFLKTSMKGTDCRRLQGTRAVFLDIDAKGLSFEEAVLDGASFVEGTQLFRCSFKASSMLRALGRGISFQECDFTLARLDGAMLMHADLSRTNFRLASGIEANLTRALLTQANFEGANLHGALLTSSQAAGANFTAVNLFATDLSRIVLDEYTCFDSALLKKARLYPRAERPQAST